MTIKVYGEKAEGINNGDIFHAIVTNIEGRKVVKLLSEKEYNKRNDD